MIWQDFIFGAGAIIFSLALLPLIFSRKVDPPPLGTSLPTSIVLASFVIAYDSLDLNFAAITSLISATLWGVLVAKRVFLLELRGEIS